MRHKSPPQSFNHTKLFTKNYFAGEAINDFQQNHGVTAGGGCYIFEMLLEPGMGVSCHPQLATAILKWLLLSEHQIAQCLGNNAIFEKN